MVTIPRIANLTLLQRQLNAALAGIDAGVVDLTSFIPAAELAAIYAGTSTYDCAPALREAIDSVTVNVIANYQAGPTILLPYGKIKVNSTIDLKRTVTIEGRSGGGMAGDYGSVVQFAADTCGFVVNRYNTINGGVESPTTTGADNSVFRNFKLLGGGGSSASAHGIWLRARATIDGVNIDSFAGNGINVVATAGGGGSAEGNANCFQIRGCRIESCGGNGIFVDGADANAGAVVGADCSSNSGWGVFDSSFLGNSYLGCHTAANVLGAYTTDNHNARTALIGCYSESGQPASALTYPTLVVGGLHGAGFTGDGGVLDVSTDGVLKALKGLQDQDGGLIARLGGNSANGDVLYTSKTTDAPSPWRLRWSGGNLIMDYANSGSAVVWTITGEATTRDFGRSVIQPRKFAADNFFIGPSNNARQHTSGAAAPASGEWGKGDICYNTSPTAGGKVGWVCVTAGTPGTWKAFGAIDP